MREKNTQTKTWPLPSRAGLAAPMYALGYTANMELALCIAWLCFRVGLLLGTRRKLLEVWGQLFLLFIVPVPTTVTGTEWGGNKYLQAERN